MTAELYAVAKRYADEAIEREPRLITQKRQIVVDLMSALAIDAADDDRIARDDVASRVIHRHREANR